MVSTLLGEDGGYSLSSSLCQDNRSAEDVARTMELVSPSMHLARARALRYLSAARRCFERSIFRLRMPLQMEVKKYSSSARFLRRVLASADIRLRQMPTSA